MNKLQEKLDKIVELYEQAIELAREEGEREVYDKCEAAIIAELDKAEGAYGDGLECALDLIRGLR